MTKTGKILVARQMPLGAVIGCAFFVVLGIFLIALGIASSEYLVAAIFLPGVVFFGMPFYLSIDPKKAEIQRREQAVRAQEARSAAMNTSSNDTVILATFIITGLIAVVALWLIIGLIASLPVGILLTIIILLLLFKR